MASCGSELDSANFDFGAAAIAGAIEPETMQAIANIQDPNIQDPNIQDPVKSLRSLLIMLFSLPRDVAMWVKYSRDAPCRTSSAIPAS